MKPGKSQRKRPRERGRGGEGGRSDRSTRNDGGEERRRRRGGGEKESKGKGGESAKEISPRIKNCTVRRRDKQTHYYYYKTALFIMIYNGCAQQSRILY